MTRLYVLPITLAVLLLIDMLYSTGTLCPLYGLFQCISTAVLFNTVTLELVMYPIVSIILTMYIYMYTYQEKEVDQVHIQHEYH